jgi:hypothetical protein
MACGATASFLSVNAILSSALVPENHRFWHATIADGTSGVRLVDIDPPFATKREFSGKPDERAYQDRVEGGDASSAMPWLSSWPSSPASSPRPSSERVPSVVAPGKLP